MEASWSFASSGAVAEPSTWAAVLAGFAGLGFAGHRVERKNAAITA
jgi:hypothetical protein